MIISTKGECTYADILRKIKADPGLQELGEQVSRIRRTQKGDLLLEIKAGNEDIVEKFQEKMEESIGKQADIKTRKQEVRVECRYLDEVTTKEELCNAVMNVLGVEGIKESAIKRLRKSYGNTQTAIISLPVDLGSKLLKIGKMKVGWVVCRIREQATIKTCYRCWEFGHFATECTNEHDRSNRCRRCGEMGHIARECSKKPECVICKQLENADTLHVAGSAKCLIFKQALNKFRK